MYTGQMLGAVQLDLKKASDLVNHDLLVQKLKLYRCSSDGVKWSESYLSARYQTECVRIKECGSKPLKVISGVPQGLVLGPL